MFVRFRVTHYSFGKRPVVWQLDSTTFRTYSAGDVANMYSLYRRRNQPSLGLLDHKSNILVIGLQQLTSPVTTN